MCVTAMFFRISPMCARPSRHRGEAIIKLPCSSAPCNDGRKASQAGACDERARFLPHDSS